eukprot:CAMPEP_0183302560 /NCGR_PEP_ID=MMETSP0160_2-20130417/8296_1 /TAXON_ID=2839 ORGANISM="Odontella Sinensis, Strain Grunow 1884" /NCGR_SAMPLE_ID=MMETSP0160_2 /ASSEMBLY_ACC=CAM_ASM_000250 /LENGTH=286 /DNA_ID=CAMNT_0025465341 /DNA_START=33 /DNA_END=893 /DNA_ORIENTATION=-
MTTYLKEHQANRSGYEANLIQFEYNGRTLDLSSTPKSEGLVDNTILEICDEMERQKQLQINHDLESTSLKSGKIFVKCRINGDNETMKRYGLCPRDPFQLMINEFCLKTGVPSAECKFNFDGNLLRPSDTPVSLDIEGDEIIDVVIQKSGLAREASIFTAKSSTPSLHPELSSSAQSTSANCVTSQEEITGSDVTSVGREKDVVAILVLRNGHSAKPKKFRLYHSDTIGKLKQGYKTVYKNRKCRSVAFYLNDSKIQNDTATLFSLGLKDMDSLVAMENGRKYSPL